MSKIVFVSFADTRYQASTDRLKRQTEAFGFDERYFFSEKDLPKDFFKGFSPKIYRRGYGYWTWKPYVVAKVLGGLQEGDILVYSDGGNVWNDKGIERFRELIDMLSMERPILAFQQEFLEKDWTKMDVFQRLCPETFKQHAMTLQLWSGSFFLMKSPIADKLAKDWDELRKTDIHQFTDRKSTIPNLLGFREARHDQSTFSLLVKQRPHVEISWEEVEPLDSNWAGYEKYPILAKRYRKKTTKKKIISYIFLSFIGYYLVLFKNFRFMGKVAWSIAIGHTVATLSNLIGGGKRNAVSITPLPLSNCQMCA